MSWQKNRPSASGARAVNQGASTSYVYVFDFFPPGYFLEQNKVGQKIALEPVALERLIRV
jgi:hypothetical protein